MRKITLSFFAAIVGFSAMITPVRAGTFKTRPADPEVLKARGPIFGQGYFFPGESPRNTPVPKTAFPAFNPRVGNLRIYGNRKQVLMLLFKSDDKKKKEDRLAIDLNGDGKLTKDEVLDVGTKLRTVSAQLNTVEPKCNVDIEEFAHNGKPAWRIALLPTTWLEGSIGIGDKELRAILSEKKTGNTMRPHSILLDINGDKMFKRDPAGVRMFLENFFLRDCLIIGGEPYLPVVTRENNMHRVELASYKGKTGTISYGGTDAGKELNKASLTFFLAADKGKATWPSGRMRLHLKPKDPSPNIPVGTYRLTYGALRSENATAIFTTKKRIAIREGENTQIRFGKPLLKPTASQKDRTIRVNRKLVAEDSTNYTSLYLYPANRKGEGPPVVEVFLKDDDSKAIASGKMEYG